MSDIPDLGMTFEGTGHLVAQVANQPIFFAEGREAELVTSLGRAEAFLDKMGAREEQAGAAATERDFWDFEGREWLAQYRPYTVKNGILHIPVKGTLLNDFPYAFASYATGYLYIREAIKRGMADDQVKGVAFIVNSPGGLVAGNFELVDMIHGYRGTKPMRSFAKDHAYSAAYNIAAAADELHMTRSGGVGSIGVVMVHVEMSGAIEARGITVNIIRSKSRKMEGNPYEKLSEKARARFQAGVDRLDQEFVSQVARNRALKESAVHATEALTYAHEEATEIGLADGVSAFEEAITAFEAQITSDEGESNMANKTEADTVLKADHDAAVAQARKDGEAAGAAAERSRISAIRNLDVAKTRPAATDLMIDLGLDAEQAAEKLATLPEETPAKGNDKKQEPKGAGAPAGMFRAGMENTQNPNIGAPGGDDDSAGDDKKDRAEGIRGLIAGAGIKGFRAPEAKQ